jgi:NADPH:quinone reductase-like Zn-dependent oxidoreductase
MTTSLPETMKAVQIRHYGGRDQLKLQNVPLPELRDTDVLVKVHAAAVNPVDWKIREGMLVEMLPHQLPLTLGWDFAGEIVAIGEKVNALQVGQAVYARPDIVRNGSYAEYIAVDASEVAAKPDSLNWQAAAAVPLTALTAWQALYDIAGLKQGDKVLIHAGAGGVGGFAIQLAKVRGAYVFSTTSTANVDYVKSLGADEVIDYKTMDFTNLRGLDVVFDTLGGEVQERSWQCLAKGGFMVSIVSPPAEEKAQEYSVRAEFCFVQPNSQQLTELAKLFDAGKLRVTIDSVYTLEDIAKAHARSEGGHARGKIVISIA